VPLTWIPVTCPVCGGLRDGSENGPPWPFHAKGRFACDCGDDPDDLVDTSAWTSDGGAEAGGVEGHDGGEASPRGSVGETSG